MSTLMLPVDSPRRAWEYHQRYARHLAEEIASGELPGDPNGVWSETFLMTQGASPQDWEAAYRACAKIVRQARTVYLSPEMVGLTQALAAAHGNTGPVLQPTDVADESGFLVLAEPAQLIVFNDRSDPWIDPDGVGPEERLVWLAEEEQTDWEAVDRAMRTRALAWQVVGPGAVHPLAHANRLFGRETTGWAQLQRHGGLVVVSYTEGRRTGGAISPGMAFAVPFGVYVEPAEPDVANLDDANRCFLVTLLRLMWQRIAPPEEWRPDRAALRRASHRKLHAASLSVLHLRRYNASGRRPPEPEPGAAGQVGSGRVLDCTIVVRGHWRFHWYPSLGPARGADGATNEASHRLIWIDAHVRGDGPLVVRPAMTAVDR